MQKVFYILVLHVFITMSVFAQGYTIKGKAVSKYDKKNNLCVSDCPISSVRIYLQSYLKDTIFLKYSSSIIVENNNYIYSKSDCDGNFSLEIPGEHLKDSLVFERWGYKTKNILVNDLKNDVSHVIIMEDEIILLPAIKIKSQRNNKSLNRLLSNPSYTSYQEIKEKIYLDQFGEQEPIFFNKYIARAIKDQGVTIEKPLVVEFVISRVGEITEIKVLGENIFEINEIIKQIFEKSPKWPPGKARGPVRNHHFALPIIFTNR